MVALNAGNHHPILCEMEDESGPAGLWVVKPTFVLSRATDRGTFGILAELAAAEVCAWTGVLTPRTGLTRFPDPLDERALVGSISGVAQLERDEIVEIFRANRGRLAFCGRYLRGAVDLRRNHLRLPKWRETSVADAVGLIVADAYMRHDDRLVENPNAVWFAGRLVAIDHGSAFAGLTRRGVEGGDLARYTRLHAPNFRSHVSFSFVRRHAKGAHWDVAVGRLEGVSATEVKALAATWPQELDHDPQSGQARLRSRMASFLEERGRHVRELVAVLRDVVAKKVKRP